MNINTRLQWRYKPASDFFLVYTDNYYTLPFSVRTRAMVLKFNYWLNCSLTLKTLLRGSRKIPGIPAFPRHSRGRYLFVKIYSA